MRPGLLTAALAALQGRLRQAVGGCCCIPCPPPTARSLCCLPLRREHEEQSCILLDHICEQYSGVDLNPEEQQRVKDLMLGDRDKAKADWRGKEWQLDIVANKRNGER